MASLSRRSPTTVATVREVEILEGIVSVGDTARHTDFNHEGNTVPSGTYSISGFIQYLSG